MKKINKTAARKLYNAGTTITIIPCNMLVSSPWYATPRYNINRDFLNFDNLCNEISAYNCNNETGNRLVYYIME